MEPNTDELKRFLENKIISLKKEVEYYEYLLSLLESGYTPIKGNKGSLEYIKNRKGETIAEVFFTPPLMKVVIKKKINIKEAYMNALSKILEDAKNSDKIEYNIISDKEDLREINITNIRDNITYNKLKVGLQTILERASA
ncbi:MULTISPECIES: hypothetical protein [Acidianus]|uniref:Uncharacterized protein n=1 Tax=Candidatus Acidianus copahuensis TaxID=1160895 RepID=A0A031LMR3_9CREN|nr:MULTISPECIES: hypothetical protein [Acidianus]EZQ04756.1 hypothetical protein CM19_08560 [Candidatus Acidianus copahuensis]NON63082.1 hypothetical protein [Acidianus sp. RZ1]